MSALKKVRWLRTLPCSTFAADRAGPIICATAAMNVSMPRNPLNHVCLGSSDIWTLMPNVLKIRWTSRAIFKTIFNVMVCLLNRVVKAASVMSTVILLDSGNPCRGNKINVCSLLNGVVAGICTGICTCRSSNRLCVTQILQISHRHKNAG